MSGLNKLRLPQLSAACLLFFCMSLRAEAKIRFDIPAQPLSASLNAVSNIAHLNVLFDWKLVRNIQAPAIEAELTSGEALAQLLVGTRLRLVQVNERTFTIVPMTETKADPKSGAVHLSPANIRLASSGTESATAGNPSADPASNDNALGGSQGMAEVIVSAQKRDERLIETPQSVSVLSGATLADMGATQLRDFANTVPGLSFQTAGAGTTQITLRGVTTGFDVSPTTAVYVDEVPYGSSTAFAQGAQAALDVGLFDLDRVEALRGPQGTLYGASAMGGLIKYVTKRPDATEFGGSVQTGVSGTQHGGVNYNFAATVNAPVVDNKVGVRASAYESHDGGYIDNPVRGETNVNRADIYGGRLDVMFTPVEKLSIRLTGFLQNISRDGEATANYTTTGAMPYGDLGQYRPFAEPFDQKFRLVSATANYDFGPAVLTSVSSYQTTQLSTDWDISIAYVPLLQAFLARTYGAVSDLDSSGTDKFSEEIRLASGKSDRLEWLIGGFYTHESSRYAEEFVLRDAGGAPAPNDLYTFSLRSRYKEYAAFGDLTWHLTQQFSVTGGLRYAHNDQETQQFGEGLFIGPRPLQSSKDDVVTYLANARYQFSDHSTAYLRYATGYRPGGPNLSGNNPVTGLPLGPPTFEADRLKSYEAGYKVETEDRRFGIDTDVYYIDWSNMQILGLKDGFALRENVSGGANIRGAEITATARPVNSFTTAAALAYQNAKLAKAAPDLGGADGERLPNVPRFTGSLNADYQLADVPFRPMFGATVRYVSARTASFNGSLNFPQYHLPAYGTVDLRAGVSFQSVRVQLYVHNLADKRGQLSDMLPQFGTRVGIIQPRTIGINAFTPF